MGSNAVPWVPVASIADPGKWSLNGGPFGSKLVSSMYVDKGVPVIRGANLSLTERFRDEDFVYVSSEKANELKAHTARSGDVIFTQRGTLGQVGLIPARSRFSTYVISQSQMKLSVDRRVADALYVYYCFRCPFISGAFVAFASSSGVPHVNLQTLREFMIPLPPFVEQRHIASILGAYDDLIEVNRRRIAVLETMARDLFEEWFVRFRFPGHEGVEIVETPEGPLPVGWTLATFGDIAREVRETVLPTDVPANTPYVGLEHIPRRSITLDSFGRANEVGSLKLRFERRDVLFGKIRPYFHKVSWAPFSGVASSDAIVFRAKKDRDFALVTALASSDAFVANSVQTSNGTKMPRANPVVLRAYPVAIPPTAILEWFQALAEPAIELGGSLQAANQSLAAARDLLLPRLISGELSVAAAERELEDAA